jgi:hypothetical protein
MSTKTSIKPVDSLETSESKWDEAISDIDSELSALEMRRAKLKQARRLIKRLRQDGAPWPGVKVLQQLPSPDDC